MSNGQQDSANATAKADKIGYVDGKMADIVAKIEGQFKLFGMQRVTVDETVTAYLQMSEDEISRLSPEELGYAEIKLSSYAFSIQKHVNTSSAIKNWADKNINLLVAKHYGQYDKFIKFEVRRELITQDNDYASRLSDIIRECQTEIDGLAYLAQSIQHVSDAFGRLARIRRKE